jgi:hypothetical protein
LSGGGGGWTGRELNIAEGKGGKEGQTKVKGGQRRVTGGGIRKVGKSRAKLKG